MTAPSDCGRRRMFNLQTVVGLLVTAEIIWLDLTRIDLSKTMPPLQPSALGLSLPVAGSLLPRSQSLPFAGVSYFPARPTSRCASSFAT